MTSSVLADRTREQRSGVIGSVVGAKDVTSSLLSIEQTSDVCDFGVWNKTPNINERIILKD